MSQALNSPLEVGIRIVALLTAIYPSKADMARLVLLDHAVVHSADFDGGDSLHPNIRGRSGELGLKRELIGKGIQIMGARGLIVREMTADGIYYSASDDSLPFLQSFDSQYLDQLRNRCSWASEKFGSVDDSQIRSELRGIFGQWAEEFSTPNRISTDD